MKVIYLIGGICNGKSTVSSMLKGQGVKVIDLDVLSQEVMQDTEVVASLESIEEGDFIKNGQIDRDYLSEYIFSSRVAVHKFDRVFFPHVKTKLDELLSKMDDDDNVLVEYSGYYGEPREDDIFLKDAHKVIWIESNLRDKLARGEERGIKPFDLTWRMRVQPFDEEYEAAADYVIHNNSTKEELGERFNSIWASCCQ
jgi:dephospho-CoA kinase